MIRSAIPLSNPAVLLVDPIRDPGWDESLRGEPGATVFYTSAWAAVLQESYGFQPFYLWWRQEGRAVGWLPLMQIQSPLTGRRGVALPYTDECGPLATSVEQEVGLMQAAFELARMRGWRYVEWRTQRGVAPGVNSSIPSFRGHRLDLTASTEQLERRLAPSVRRAIRKARRNDIRVEFSRELEALRVYYLGLHLATRRRHGLPPQPWKFFRLLHEHLLLGKRGFVALARHGARPVAGAVFLQAGPQALFKYGASDQADQSLRANNLLMWESIQFLQKQGCQTLSFGRTSTHHDGLRRFKLGWAPEEYDIFYQRMDARGQVSPVLNDAANGWYNPLFRRLPTPLSRCAGAFLHRHWA